MKNQYPKNKYVFDVEIVFGNPQLSCDRFGICKIIEAENLEPYTRAFQRAVAICHYQPTIKKLRIDFWQKSMSQGTRKHYFNSRYFLIEKDCTPTLLLKENSLLPASFLIEEGLYPIDFENEDFFSVNLALTANNTQIYSEKAAVGSY